MTSKYRSVRRSRAVVSMDGLERRRLLCGLSLEALIDPPKFDWAVEAAESSRLARDGGAEAVSLFWSNRGQVSDAFTAAFGTLADRARGVVDAVFTQWSRIITSFNRSDGTSTLQINLNMATGAGFSAAGGPSATAPADGKPRTGSITINRGNNSADPNDDNGWFLDTTPMDNAEFLGNVVHAFNARATNIDQGVDFFSVINLELAHVLGFISDKFNNGGAYQGYRLENFATNTGLPDTLGGGGFGTLYTFNGPNIQHLMTSYNSGDNNPISWGNVVHTAEGGSINIAGNTWSGVNDEGNAWFDGGERVMPSFVTAQILADAYGYSIVHPATFATSHAVLNQSSGLLTIRGGGSATSGDLIVLDADGTDLIVTIDIGEDVAGSGALRGPGNLPAYVTRIPIASVNHITIQGGGGNDIIRIERNAGRDVFVDAGPGDDFIDFGFGTRNLSTIAANVIVQGGSGTNHVFVYDNNNPSATTYTITSGRFDRPGWGGFGYTSGIDGLTLTTGTGSDVVDVTSTYYGQPIFLNSAGGADVVNIGNASNGMRSIYADVEVQNDPSWTTLNLLNTADTGNRFWEINNDGAFGFIRDLAPAVISWDNNDINDINLFTGAGADTGLIARLSETLTINNDVGTARDSIIFGDRIGGGGMVYITPGRLGGVRVDNMSSYTDITFDDTGNIEPRTINLTEASNRNLLSGMSPASIDFDGIDTRSITLITGQGPDTLNVSRLRTGFLTDASVRLLSSGTGIDIVNVGNDTDGVQAISTPNSVTVTAPSSYGVLNLNNSGDTTARDVTITIDASIPGETLQIASGLSQYGTRFMWAPADFSYMYTGVTITTGNQADVVRVRNNLVPLTLYGSRGPLTDESKSGAMGRDDFETVIIGDDIGGIGGILDGITIHNPPNYTKLIVNDLNTPFGKTVNFSEAEGFGVIDVTGLTTIRYNLADTFRAVEYFGGSGHDQFVVTQSSSGFPFGGDALDVWGGAGDDQMTLGSNFAGLRTIDPIDGSVYFDGGSGADLIRVNNQDASSTSLTVDTQLIYASSVATYHSQVGCEIFEVNLSNSGDALTVSDTLPTFSVFVRSGAGPDRIDVEQTRPGTRVYVDAASDGSTGVDTVAAAYYGHGPLWFADVRMIGGYLGRLLVGWGGYLALSSTPARTNGLVVEEGGRLDLGSGALAYNYAGASPLSLIKALITSGYDGGTWMGEGITSIPAYSVPGRTVGYAEASDVLGPGATSWLGLPIDDSTVLMRHTLRSDFNLDGAVGFNDLLRLAQNYGKAPAVFAQGDTDFDDDVDFDDLLRFAQQYGQTRLSTSDRFGPSRAARRLIASIL